MDVNELCVNRISVKRVLYLCYLKRYVGIFAHLLLDLKN